MLNSKIKIFLVLILTIVITVSTASKTLPGYLKPCKEHDPNLNACALESAKAGISSIIKGDKKYNIPPMNPLTIDKVEIPGQNLDLTFTNMKIWGLDQIVVQDIKLDVKNQHIELEYTSPEFRVETEYKIDGHILIVPIKGEGKANVTFVDVEIQYNDDYIKEIRDDGEEYLKFTNPNLKYDTKKAHFNLDNLFNGDKALSDAAHNFLNENYEDIAKEMGPPFIKAIELIASQIMAGIASTVPYKNLWEH